MAELDSSIITQATSAQQAKEKPISYADLVETGQQIKSNQQKLTLGSQAIEMGDINIQQARMEMGDNAKLTAVLKDLASANISSSDPQYADKVQAGLQKLGVDAKFQLEIKKGLLDTENKQVDMQYKQVQTADAVLKMDATKREQYLTSQEDSIKDLQGIEEVYKASGNDSNVTKTYISNHLDEEIKNGVKGPDGKPITPQIKEQIMKLAFPDGKTFNEEGFKQQLELTKGANKIVKERLAVEEQERQKAAADLEQKKAQAQKERAEALAAGRQVTPIQVTDPESNTTSTHIAVTDKATGKTVDTGAIAAPKGTSGQAGGRESVLIQRVITGANEAVGDLKNIVDLPASSTSGLLGRDSSGGVLTQTKNALANKLSTQDTQSYNTMIAGIQRNLAAIEASGLAPSGTLTHQMDAVVLQPGDTEQTKLRKTAQIRQIIENGLDPLMANPRVAPEQKKEIEKILAQAKKVVPYTQQDITKLTQSKSDVTLGDIAKQRGLDESVPDDVQALLDKYKK